MDMPTDDSEYGTILAYEHLRIVICVNVASAALFIYDYFLTFPREVSLIWPTRWTPTKVIFLLTRYLVFFDIGFFLYSHFQARDVMACHIVGKAISWWFFVGTALSEVILTVRTWAVWSRSLPLGICLLIFLAMCWVPSIPIFLIYNKSLDFTLVEMPPLLGCLTVKSSNIAFASWILLLVNEFGLFLLMLLKAVQCYNNGGMSGLSLIVYRDGLLYYLYLFVFSLANVVIMGTISPHLKSLLILTERVVHPMLACRVILGMRGYVVSQSENSGVQAIPRPSLQYSQDRTLMGQESTAGSSSKAASMWKS